MKNKGKQIAKQGAILAITSFVVRFIGILYRIPMTNILGDEGNGYYSNAFNIYAYLLIISSYAMPTAISRIVSSQLALKQKKEAHQLFKASVVLNIVISAFFSLMLFYIAAPYSRFISNPGAEIAMKSLAPSLVIFAVMASFRGYFQGMHTMIPTALSQIIEQVFNVIFSIVLALVLKTWGLKYAAAGGTIGTGVGALSGLLFLTFIYIVYRNRLPKQITANSNLNFENMMNWWKIILLTSIPMVIGTATFNISTIIDDVMFNRALYFHNYSQQEISTFTGIVGGKYNLIITMPIAIATAIATAGVPSIAASVTLNNTREIIDKIKISLKSVVIIALPASMGIYVLAGPILNLIFKMDSLEQVTTNMLRIGAVTIFLFSISTLSIGVLQGLGYIKIPVHSAVKSILIKIIANFVFFYAFNFNLNGAAFANIVFSFASAYFNLTAVLHKTKMHLNYKEIFIRPSIATLIMGVITFLSYIVFDIFLPTERFLGNLVAIVGTIVLAMISYFILIIKLKIMSLEELSEMPMGGRIVRFARKFY